MATVKTVDLRDRDLVRGVAEIFEGFGGGRALLKSSGDVFLKVNAVDFKPNVYTDPLLVKAVIHYFRDCGARTVHVIENCTQGNFTRLVFNALGLDRICREEKAVAVYLDETGAVPVLLPTLERFIDVSSLVHERLIRRREENLYVSIPVLKTHSMTQVTLGIKNQIGLIHHASRIEDHNFNLHRKIADLFQVVQPDFTLIDAQRATDHGHYPAEAFAKDCVQPMGLLLGGIDTLAVDTVGAHLMGYAVDQVEHLRLVREDGLGCGELEDIYLPERTLVEGRRRNLTHELLRAFPEGVTVLRGKERCCAEGCRCNTEAMLEVFGNDVGCRHPFTIVMGKGVDPEAVARIDGPVLVAGSCAVEEHAAELHGRLGPRRVFTSPGCNDLARTSSALISLMGISALKVAGINPLKALPLLALARMRGSRARVTDVLSSRVRR